MASKKTATPKNILAPLRIKTVEKPVMTGDVVTIRVEGDYPTRYNEAASIGKKAKELMDDMKPAMTPDALVRVFDHNSEKPWEPIASVAFQDDAGNVTRISFTSKYSDIPAEVAEKLFGRLKTKMGAPANINDYLARTVTGTFNSDAFLGTDGKFSKERYDKITNAMETVAKELGIENPLATETSVKPQPSFHARRWTDFDKPSNLEISKVLINQVMFSPCPNVVTKKMVGEEEEAK